MDVTRNSLQIGVVHWNRHDGIARQTAHLLQTLGQMPVTVRHDARLPADLDLVFTYGPFRSLVPIANQLIAFPRSRRPAFAWWITEQLPNPDLPEWLRYGLGTLRSRAERLAFEQRSPGEWRTRPLLHWLTARGHRFRYYGDLYWLDRQGVLSALVTGSRWRAEYLRARGFDPILAPSPSHYPGWGADLKLERDIPVLWIGKVGSARRGRLLKRLRKELGERGVEILMIDGREHPYVFGDDRTVLLNRTLIVVNFLRQRWDNNAMRFALAAQNRALIVTEPTLPHTSFVPGEHLIEAPIERMADVICHYLSAEGQRAQIVERAYRLVAKTTRAEVLTQIVGKAVQERKKAPI